MKNRIPFLPGWAVLRRSYAFKDIDSATAIEQTAKIYKAMQDLIEDYNKFVLECNKVIEEFIESSTQDQNCFVERMTKVIHDYIDYLDTKVKDQDLIIADAVKYMKDNLSESISTVVSEMRESGEMNDVILAGLEDIKTTLQTQAEDITTNATNIENNSNDINTLDTKVGELTSLNTSDNSSVVNAINSVNTEQASNYEELTNTIGSLDNLNFAEIGGDTANVVAAINAVHRRLDNEMETTGESINQVETNLSNLSGNVYTKDNYLIIESKATVLTANEPAAGDVELPDGFTAENTVLLSKTFNPGLNLTPIHYYYGKLSDPNFTFKAFNDADAYTYCQNLTDLVEVQMYTSSSGKNYVSTWIRYSANDSVGTEYDYKLVLLKYKD